MNPLTRLLLAATTLSLGLSSNALGAEAATPNPIKHSYLVMGARTAIIGEDGQVAWEYKGGTRDGFILPNGNLLAAWVDRVEEVSPSKQVVGTYVRSAENSEIGTVQRLYNGNTLVTELGKRPRLLEVDTQGKIVRDVPLQPETDNAHMQTRMARQLRNGNYLVPHLLAFAVKEYTPEGQVVATIRTDLAELGGRPQENWPFTAIRLDNGNTLVSLTHGNKVADHPSRQRQHPRLPHPRQQGGRVQHGRSGRLEDHQRRCRRPLQGSLRLPAPGQRQHRRG